MLYPEELLSYNGENLSNITKSIKQDCSEYLLMNDISKTCLYRGINFKYEADIYRYPANLQNNPIDRLSINFKAINQIAEQRLIANRNNSIYTTGSKIRATDFGSQCYIVIPKDGFKYTWHPEIPDLYESSHKDGEYLGDDNTLKEAIISGNEVMIHADYVYLVNTLIYDTFLYEFVD